MDGSVQSMLTTFMALLLAHLLGDFPFQPERIARDKGKSPWSAFAHMAIHYGTAWACLLFFAHISYLSIFNQLILAGYLLVHLTIDVLKYRLIARKPNLDNGNIFLLDQFSHLVTIATAATVLTRSHIVEVIGSLRLSATTKFHILVVAIIYVGVIFGGGYLIRYLTKGLAKGITTESTDQLKNAGLYIGWIERLLVITAIAVQSPAIVGLILTGKSIARFPELKESQFAEYFLIGTLMSIALAVLGGLILARMLYGTFSLK
jgi:Protein of unknown function (DUF3307)